MDFDLNVKQTIKKGAFLQGIWFDIQTGFLYVADEGEPIQIYFLKIYLHHIYSIFY